MKTHSSTSFPFVIPATKQRPVAKQETASAVELITSSLPINLTRELSITHRKNIAYVKQHVGQRINGEITIGGKKVHVIKMLGTGGSKTVFDVEWNGYRLALALPHTTSGIGKWCSALKDPENTERVRELGLCTNTLCEAIPIKIDDVEFLGLVMNRYEDLPYLVFDTKDTNYLLSDREPLIPEGGLNVKNFVLMVSPVMDDLATVLKSNIRMGSDCFSTCIDKDGKLRMFFSDLGQGMHTTDKPVSYDTALGYAAMVLDRWACSFKDGDDQIKSMNADFFLEFEKGSDDPTSLQAKVAQEIMKRVSTT